MSLAIPTADQQYAAYQAEVQARQSSLTDFNAGSALDALAGATVIESDLTIRIALDQFSGKMIATATGSDLDAAVVDRYPTLTRRATAAAVGTLRFTRGGSSGVLTVPAGTTVTATVNGRTVTVTTDAAAYMPAASTTIDSRATCSEVGTVGNLAIGTLTRLPTPLSGDSTATVTNLDRFAGGAIAETDDAYRQRAQAYPGTLRRGTVAALEEGALTVPGVAYVTVDESAIATSGWVYVYVGDPDGRGNTALAALVATELDNWRAAGVRVSVLGAARYEVDLTLTVYVRSGTATDALREAIVASVLAYTDNIAASAAFYFSQAEAAATTVSADVLGAIATSTYGTAPYFSPPDSYKAIRVPSSSITVTFVEVAG